MSDIILATDSSGSNPWTWDANLVGVVEVNPADPFLRIIPAPDRSNNPFGRYTWSSTDGGTTWSLASSSINTYPGAADFLEETGRFYIRSGQGRYTNLDYITNVTQTHSSGNIIVSIRVVVPGVRSGTSTRTLNIQSSDSTLYNNYINALEDAVARNTAPARAYIQSSTPTGIIGRNSLWYNQAELELYRYTENMWTMVDTTGNLEERVAALEALDQGIIERSRVQSQNFYNLLAILPGDYFIISSVDDEGRFSIHNFDGERIDLRPWSGAKAFWDESVFVDEGFSGRVNLWVDPEGRYSFLRDENGNAITDPAVLPKVQSFIRLER